MKVAVVGLGYWGPNILRNLVSLIGSDNVVAVEQSPSRLQAACAPYPGVHRSSSLDDVLDDPRVEAVVLATPVSTHAPLARRCLARGRHVLVEKPLAASPVEAAQLVLLAEERERVLMVGHTFLFSPRVEEVVRVMERRVLGKIHYVTSARLNLGLHQRDVGVIWDLAAHDFSILFHLLGEFPVEVQTNGRAVVDGARLDVAFMNLTFGSGVVANVNVSWLSPRKVRNTIIVGDRQMLSYDDLDSDEPVKIYDKGIDMPEPNNFGEHQLTYRYGDVLVPHIAAREPLRQELTYFLAAVESGQCDRSSARFGLRVVEALEAAERSWCDAQTVAIEPTLPDEQVIDLRTFNDIFESERLDDVS